MANRLKDGAKPKNCSKLFKMASISKMAAKNDNLTFRLPSNIRSMILI